MQRQMIALTKPSSTEILGFLPWAIILRSRLSKRSELDGDEETLLAELSHHDGVTTTMTLSDACLLLVTSSVLADHALVLHRGGVEVNYGDKQLHWRHKSTREASGESTLNSAVEAVDAEAALRPRRA